MSEPWINGGHQPQTTHHVEVGRSSKFWNGLEGNRKVGSWLATCTNSLKRKFALSDFSLGHIFVGFIGSVFWADKVCMYCWFRRCTSTKHHQHRPSTILKHSLESKLKTIKVRLVYSIGHTVSGEVSTWDTRESPNWAWSCPSESRGRHTTITRVSNTSRVLFSTNGLIVTRMLI